MGWGLGGGVRHTTVPRRSRKNKAGPWFQELHYQKRNLGGISTFRDKEGTQVLQLARRPPYYSNFQARLLEPEGQSQDEPACALKWSQLRDCGLGRGGGGVGVGWQRISWPFLPWLVNHLQMMLAETTRKLKLSLKAELWVKRKLEILSFTSLGI